jgi:hypothetical protein
MDRNLGAAGKPNSRTDYLNAGDLFQWGRPADGHQLINRGLTIETTLVINGSVNILSDSNVPGHPYFITNATLSPYDWKSTQNDDLWGAKDRINNPCPVGWHIPSQAEWEAENMYGTSQDEKFKKLKLTGGGYRFVNGGGLELLSWGIYWTSTSILPEPKMAVSFYTIGTDPISGDWRGDAMSCRCIKDL